MGSLKQDDVLLKLEVCIPGAKEAILRCKKNINDARPPYPHDVISRASIDKAARTLAPFVDSLYKIVHNHLYDKNLHRSIEHRKAANKLMESGDFLNALGFFSLSVIMAPTDSPELAQAYANRSELLRKMEMYEASIQDAQRALDLEYPELLRYKLILRQAFCLYRLNQRVEALDKMHEAWIAVRMSTVLTEEKQDFIIKGEMSTVMHNTKPGNKKGFIEILHREPPPVAQPAHPQYPDMSSAVEVAEDEIYGRKFLATRDIDVGEILLVEEPFAVALVPYVLQWCCCYCLKSCYNPIPCPTCSNVMFCSAECRQTAWERFHSEECILLKNVLGMCEKLNYTSVLLFVRTLCTINQVRLGELLDTYTESPPPDEEISNGEGEEEQKENQADATQNGKGEGKGEEQAERMTRGAKEKADEQAVSVTRDTEEQIVPLRDKQVVGNGHGGDGVFSQETKGEKEKEQVVISQNGEQGVMSKQKEEEQIAKSQNGEQKGAMLETENFASMSDLKQGLHGILSPSKNGWLESINEELEPFETKENNCEATVDSAERDDESDGSSTICNDEDLITTTSPNLSSASCASDADVERFMKQYCNLNTFASDEMVEWIVVSLMAARALEYEVNEEETYSLVMLMVHIANICWHNNRACTHGVLTKDKLIKKLWVGEIGHGTYPRALHLVNHSCRPNTCLHPYGRSLVMRAIEPISKGSQLTINYNGKIFETRKEVGEGFLKCRYGFECKCEVCCGETPHFEDLPDLLQFTKEEKHNEKLVQNFRKGFKVSLEGDIKWDEKGEWLRDLMLRENYLRLLVKTGKKKSKAYLWEKAFVNMGYTCQANIGVKQEMTDNEK